MKQIAIAVATALTLLATPVLAEEINGGGGSMPRTEDRRVSGLPYREDKPASTTPRVQNLMDRKASSTERLQDLRMRIEAKSASTTARLGDIKMRIEERKASSTERRVEMQQDVAKRHAENVARVLSATIERLEKILDRVVSRIEKVKSAGGDTTMSENAAASAKAHLDQAKIGLEVFNSIDLSADKAKENFSTVRAAAATVKDEIKAAHKSLKDAVSSLKGHDGDEDEHGTSTKPTASSTSH